MMDVTGFEICRPCLSAMMETTEKFKFGSWNNLEGPIEGIVLDETEG